MDEILDILQVVVAPLGVSPIDHGPLVALGARVLLAIFVVVGIEREPKHATGRCDHSLIAGPDEFLDTAAEPATLLRIILLIARKQIIELRQILNSVAVVFYSDRLVAIINPDIQIAAGIQRVLDRSTNPVEDITVSVLFHPTRDINTEDTSAVVTIRHNSHPTPYGARRVAAISCPAV